MKTLEVWVDNLNPEFLEPAMSEVISDLMHGLWALLKYNNPLATKVRQGRGARPRPAWTPAPAHLPPPLLIGSHV